MIKIKYTREAVCLGDDVSNGNYTITLKNTSTLEDLINCLIHGGNGNNWSLAFTGSSTHWIIKSNIKDLAEVYVDDKYNWCINYLNYDKDTLLKNLNIEYVKGVR